MTKIKTKFVCQVCGYESIRWLGRCPNCQSWNSFLEISEKEERVLEDKTDLKVVTIEEIEEESARRLETDFKSFDQLLGGGIVEGALILLGGEPGIGKSTFLLQIALSLQRRGNKVLYISAEESLPQISLRLKRLYSGKIDINFTTEKDIDVIIPFIEKEKPPVVIVDSIQTVYSSEFPTSPGNVVQVRECTIKLMNLAKKAGISIFLISHITKEGDIAGPKLLEHLVDVVLYFEGERYHDLRVLRAIKNRFGPTNDLALYEMKEEGLIEVADISERFLENRNKDISGSVVVPVMEGTRPILVEFQALVSKTNTSYPRRIASGIDLNKLILILAILEKKLRLNFLDKDVFFNVVGGVRVDEPAADLGIALAVFSALVDKPFPNDTVAVGELGLGGEVRSIGNLEKRVREATKLGFSKILVPKNVKIKDRNMEFIQVSHIYEGISKVWGEGGWRT
ncbi:MAG TPA: DNA repair protein RadA [Dictyoglomaceae bacterium]|nr:DNA repair protein RadA [Dictyoglomaceae bacterium]HOL39121.1 DNA repair protein RadA [Dictyoglomaceae bacterium]HOP94270.1 DNA repair protein RadA [Dictyoglomaceae bacterium]HPP15275.1 DNA repair protein RadA [Dictyoglomaceae bacterium]HPU42681.1 DNA repair protein RadA [Dictyoglomaceae bacterium]